jgi:hypothetical protein
VMGPERVVASTRMVPRCSCEACRGRWESRSSRVAVSAEEEICGIKAMTAVALAVLKSSMEKTVRMGLTL